MCGALRTEFRLWYKHLCVCVKSSEDGFQAVVKTDVCGYKEL